MASTFKVLGQINPSVTTLTTIYTVPGATQAIVSQVFVTNRSATATTFRFSVAVAGAADDPKQYVYYDAQIDGNATLPLGAFTLGAADVLRGYAGAATLTFSAFGEEMT